MNDRPHFHGHRQRLRERFMRAGGESLHDYEMLELLLFQASARGDMKPLAKALLNGSAALPPPSAPRPSACARLTASARLPSRRSR